MKIIALCGSPRGSRSQTNKLTEKLLESAASSGAATELIDLAKLHIGFCQACENCHEGPDCILNDDGRTVMDKMLEADGIVLASPVYLNQVTAQMKGLLDRTSHFIHCLRLMGKYMATVTTSGGGGGAQVHEWLRHYAVMVGAQYVGSIDAPVPLQPADFSSAADLGQDLFAAIREKRVYADQLQRIELQKKRFGQLIAIRKDLWPFEFAYWRKMQWI